MPLPDDPFDDGMKDRVMAQSASVETVPEDIKRLGFEDAMKELERIVKDLESGQGQAR